MRPSQASDRCDNAARFDGRTGGIERTRGRRSVVGLRVCCRLADVRRGTREVGLAMLPPIVASRDGCSPPPPLCALREERTRSENHCSTGHLEGSIDCKGSTRTNLPLSNPPHHQCTSRIAKQNTRSNPYKPDMALFPKP